MLLRLTVALVLAGVGLLVAGVVRDSLGLIYLSILCTAIAGVALVVYVQVSRRQAARLATEADLAEWRAREADESAAAAGGPGEGPVNRQDAPISREVGPSGGSRPAVPQGPAPSAPDAVVEPPLAAGGGWRGPKGHAFGASPESGTDQPEPGGPPGAASGEATPPGS